MNTTIAGQTDLKTDEEYKAEFYRVLAEMERLGQEIDETQQRTAKIREESRAIGSRVDAILDHVARDR